MSSSTFHLWSVVLVVIPLLASCQPSAELSTRPTAPFDHNVHPDRPEVFILTHYGYLTFSSVGVKGTSQFVIFQVFTQHARLTLTSMAPSPSASISGNSVGMVTMVNRTSSGLTWTLSLTNVNDSSAVNEEVEVLVILQEYDTYAPIPGGCNQVFELETDPNIRLTPKDFRTEVWFQWANVGGLQGASPPNCEIKSYSSRLTYEVYVQFVPESDDSSGELFDVVRSMATVGSLKQSSQLIKSVSNDGTAKSLMSVTSQAKQGAVYGVVVRDALLGTEASYVSAVTYACNKTAGECSMEHSVVEWTLFVFCVVCGLFLLLLGHSWFFIEMFVFGFLAFSLISFTLIAWASAASDGVNFGGSCALGLLGGAVWVFVWRCLSFPSISVMLPGLTAGYLIAGTFFFTPFANIPWWASSLNYGLIFTCLALLFTVCLLFNPRLLNIVSCSLVGGYCATAAIAILLRSSLVLIVVNVISHARVSGYGSAIVVSPFQINDMILAGLWAVLLAAGIGWQYHRNWGKPHFPSKRNRHGNQRPRANRAIQEGMLPSSNTADENTPLLSNPELPPSYDETVGPPTSHPPPEATRGNRNRPGFHHAAEMKPPPV